ncbi:hypothetical protein [Clostridioides sp. ZZV15-6598]|uniref:hypothetical protein n=1 Tax=Clostridioides sp. ZZV15-6598 TaxID=2811501 RepID=UPI001D10E90B|nr:hypothetical protein [Clostridioides sp. ZZV15-6598]
MIRVSILYDIFVRLDFFEVKGQLKSRHSDLSDCRNMWIVEDLAYPHIEIDN